MDLIYKWNYTLVFDGCPPQEKRHEHQRRRQKEDTVVIKATFIAMCVLICRRRFAKYVVSPAEADMQVGRLRAVDAIVAIPVCRDSDEIAYGNRRPATRSSIPISAFGRVGFEARWNRR